MPSYTAGTAYLRIVPSMTGFHTRLRNEIRNIRPEPTVEVRIVPRWDGANIPPIPDRTVNIRADVDRRSFADAVNGVALLGRSLATLAIPAALAAGIPILGALAGAATASAGALLLLPAAGAAAGIAIGAVKIGMSGFADTLKEADPAKFAEGLAKLSPAAQDAAVSIRGLGPAWTSLRLDVQDALFRNIGSYIRELSGSYLPILRTGLIGAAEAFSFAAGGAFEFLQSQRTMSDLSTIFTNSNASIKIMSGSLDAMLRIFRDVAVVGSEFLPGLATGWAGAAQRASEHVAAMRESGQLANIIQGGLDALSQLGQLFSHVGNIIGTVWRAAGEAGNSFLQTMITATYETAVFLNSANGYGALVTIFTTMREVVAALIPGLLVFASSIATGIQILGPALPPIAAAFSAVLAAVSPLIVPLSQIASVLATALAGAVMILVPLLSDMATIVGSILLAALRAVEPLFPIILDVLRQLVPPLTSVATIIGDALVGALRVLAPVLPPLAASIGALVVAAGPLVEVIVRLASNILSALLPALPPLIGAFTRFINEAVVPLLPLLGRLVESLMPGIVATINVAVPVIVYLANILINNLAGAITGIVIPVIETLIEWIDNCSQFWRDFSATVSTVWREVGQWITSTWNGVVLPVFNALVSFIRDVLEVAFNVLWTTVRIAIGAIGAIIVLTWNTIIKPIYDAIVAFMTNVLGPIFVWFQREVIEPVWTGIRTAISIAWNFIRDLVFAPIVAFVDTRLAPVFRGFEQTSNSVWTGIRAGIDAAWSLIRDNVFAPLSNFMTRTLPDAFATGTRIMGDLWNGIKKTMRDPVQAVIDVVYNRGIVASWNAIADFIGLGNQKLAPFTLPQYASGGPVTSPTVALIGEAGPEYVLSAPAVRNMGGMAAVDAMHRQATDRRTFRDLQAGRLVEGADHEGAGYSRSGFGGVQPFVAQAGHFLKQKFGIGSVGGVGSRPNASDHPKGLALDFMTSGNNGTQLAQYVIANKGHLGVTYAIWRQQINTGSGWRNMEDRGSPTANHLDHVHVSFGGGALGGAQGSNGGLAEGGGGFDPLGFIAEKFGSLAGLLGEIKTGGKFGEILRGFGSKAWTAVKDWALGKVTGWAASVGNWIGSAVQGVAGFFGGGARGTAQKVAERYGWGSGPQWDALSALVQKESSWNPNAQNPTSTAYGLFQFLNGTWAQTGIGKTSDPALQTEAGLRYIKGRYGTPSGALAFHNRNNWYDAGGVASGRGFMLKNIIAPERTLSPRQTRAFDHLVNNITGRGFGARLAADRGDEYSSLTGGGGRGPLIGSLTVPVPEGSTVHETLDTVMTRVRHEERVSDRYSRPGGG